MRSGRAAAAGAGREAPPTKSVDPFGMADLGFDQAPRGLADTAPARIKRKPYQEALISMRLASVGFTAAMGSFTVRTPLSMLASMSSALMPAGSSRLRTKAP